MFKSSLEKFISYRAFILFFATLVFILTFSSDKFMMSIAISVGTLFGIARFHYLGNIFLRLLDIKELTVTGSMLRYAVFQALTLLFSDNCSKNAD